MSSLYIWIVGGNMENAKIIWQVAGKVKVQVAKEVGSPDKVGEWQENLVSGKIIWLVAGKIIS